MTATSLADFLSADEVAALRRPTAEAIGLPGRVYTDPGFFELERRTLFSRSWMAVAFENDLPDPGDVFPVDAAGFPLVAVRGKDGTVRVFYNVCAHRGMQVVPEACSGRARLTCPWHAWSYDLEGRLTATPGIGGAGQDEAEGFDKAGLRLRAVRAECAMNFVFVNLDGRAPPLAEHLAPVAAHFGAYDLSLLRYGGVTFETVFQGNWKLANEGGCEDYHLPWIHPEIEPQGEFATMQAGDCYVGIRNRRTVNGMRAKFLGSKIIDGEKTLPWFPNLAGAEEIESSIVFMVPTAVFALNPDHAVTTLFIPLDHERTLLRRAYHFLGEAAADDEHATLREKIQAGWARISTQDGPLIEQVQRLARAREDQEIATRFSPFWEQAVHHFQKMVVDRIEP